VASTITWLATEESAALSGHAFEVTNGMQVPAQSRSKLVSWPDKRLEDLSNQVVLVLGGSEVEEALSFAERHMMSGARVVLAFRSLESLGYARSMSAARGMDSVHLLHLEPLRRESADRCFDYIRDHFGSLDGIVVLPRYGNGQHGYSLSTAGDDDVEAFVRDQIVSPVAFASTLATNLDRWGFLKEAPALTYVTNPSDGHGNLFNDITRAAVEALIRIWRHEDEQMRRKGERDWAILPNQLVRYDNDEGDNLTFSADWAATLTNRVRRMDAINLWVPDSIKLDGQGGHADGDPARPARPAQGQDRGHHRRQPRHRPAAGTLPGDRRRPRAALGPFRGEAARGRGRDHRGAARRRLSEARGARAHPAGHRRGRRGGAAAPLRTLPRAPRPRGFPDQQRGDFRCRGDGRRHDPRRLEPHHARQPDLQLLADPQVRAADEGAGIRRGDERVELLRR
jgi:hypothetical protein